MGGIAAPWIPIPQAEEIPLLGTVVDLFAVIVLVGLIASSIRRYLHQAARAATHGRRHDRRLAHRRADGHLPHGRSGRPRRSNDAGPCGHGWGQTWLPFGTLLAQALAAVGVSAETIVRLGVGAWWVHALILLFFLVYLPYSKHMHLLWAPAAVFFAELPHKGVLPPSEEKDDGGGDAANRPTNPLAGFTWRMLLNGYACAECGRCERVCPVAASGAKLSPRQVVHDLKEFVLTKGLAAVQGRPGKWQWEGIRRRHGRTRGHLGLRHLPRLRGQVPGPQRACFPDRRNAAETGRAGPTRQHAARDPAVAAALRQFPDQVAEEAVRLGQGPARAVERRPEGARRDALVPRRLRGLSSLVDAGLAH